MVVILINNVILTLLINLGMTGLLGVVMYSIYNFKNKSPGTKTSVYVIQTRVAAQGFVIACLTVGLGYKLINSYFHPELRKERHEAPQYDPSAIGTQRYK